MNLRTSPDDFFRASLVLVSRDEPWLLQALDLQTDTSFEPERPATVLHGKAEVRAFLNDLAIDSWVGYPRDAESSENASPSIVPATPEEILAVIQSAIDRGVFGGIKVCSTRMKVVQGIHTARAWFRNRPSIQPGE